MHDLLIVPVRGNGSPGGALTLHTGRLHQGTSQGPRRVGLAFTDEALLRAALGEAQQWIRLAEPALRAMLRPVGITLIQVDPLLVGPRLNVVLWADRYVTDGAQTASAYS